MDEERERAMSRQRQQRRQRQRERQRLPAMGRSLLATPHIHVTGMWRMGGSRRTALKSLDAFQFEGIGITGRKLGDVDAVVLINDEIVRMHEGVFLMRHPLQFSI